MEAADNIHPINGSDRLTSLEACVSTATVLMGFLRRLEKPQCYCVSRKTGSKEEAPI
jgi:hypothetical protein